VYGLHGLHGRSLPLAAGIKLANSGLTVIAEAGDGDGFSEGMGHFIHACRRNINLTYIVHNNGVFALTTGQTSSTGKQGFISNSSPFGTIEILINIMQVCVSFNPEKSYKWYKERVYKLENEDQESSDRNKALNLALTIGEDRLPTGVLYQHKQALYEDSLPQIKESLLVKNDIGNIDINSLMADFV